MLLLQPGALHEQFVMEMLTRQLRPDPFPHVTALKPDRGSGVENLLLTIVSTLSHA